MHQKKLTSVVVTHRDDSPKRILSVVKKPVEVEKKIVLKNNKLLDIDTVAFCLYRILKLIRKSKKDLRKYKLIQMLSKEIRRYLDQSYNILDRLRKKSKMTIK
jgi:hypothetical protein